MMIDQDFALESLELLGEAEEALLAMEKGEDFASNYKRVFRCFHSLKGAFGMFGESVLEKHFHSMEDELDKHKSAVKISSEMLGFFLQGIDGTKKYFETGVFTPVQKPAAAKTEVKKVEVRVKEDLVAKKVSEAWITPIETGVKPSCVYVVEDEDDIRDFLCKKLSKCGYVTKGFANGLDALAAFEGGILPDLIVTDLQMPKMGGMELLQKVHAIAPLVPVIVASAHVTKEACIQALADGVSGIIEKPFNIDQLLKMSEHCIRRYRSFKALKKTLNFVSYQFYEVDQLLAAAGKDDLRELLKCEIKNLMKEKTEIESLAKNSVPTGGEKKVA